jgi:hypothetical protein
MSRWSSGGNQARTDRWKREDEAPRLQDEVPELSLLKLELHEISGERRVLDSGCVRHIVVPRAGALFEVPCGDSACEDGGFEMTLDILHELRRGHTEFSGEAPCHGSVGYRPCGRVLKYTALATFHGQGS